MNKPFTLINSAIPLILASIINIDDVVLNYAIDSTSFTIYIDFCDNCNQSASLSVTQNECTIYQSNTTKGGNLVYHEKSFPLISNSDVETVLNFISEWRMYTQ